MSEVVVEYIWTLGGAQFLIQQGILILYGLILGGMAYKHHVRRQDCDSLRRRVYNLERHAQEIITLFRWSLTASDEEKEKLFRRETFKWTRS